MVPPCLRLFVGASDDTVDASVEFCVTKEEDEVKDDDDDDDEDDVKLIPLLKTTI